MKRSSALLTLVSVPLARRTAFASDLDTVRVSTVAIDSSLELNYAQLAGITAKNGLKTELSFANNGAAITAAIVGGSVDVGITNTFSLLAAHERNVPIVALAMGQVYNPKAPTAVLMVENSSPLQTARDLNGKTVAVDGLRNITQFAVMAWMDKNGGDPSSLKFVEMPFAEMGAALAAKRVDAAQISEPAASGARANARVFAQSYDAIGSSFATTAWVATAAWAHANPGIVKRLVQTVYDGARWANVNRDRTAEVLSKVSGMQIDVIRRINRSTFAERYTPGLITPVIDVALRYGAITKAITPNDVFAMDALR